MRTNIHLSEGERKAVGIMLGALLADQFALGTRMRNCRWNATGPQTLQRLFALHDEILSKILDDLSERARVTGNGKAAAVAEFLKLARSKAQPGVHPRAAQITAELLAGHEAVIYRLRDNLALCSPPRGDVPTREFLNGLVLRHEKMAGELRALAEQTNQRWANSQANRLEAQQATCDSI